MKRRDGKPVLGTTEDMPPAPSEGSFQALLACPDCGGDLLRDAGNALLCRPCGRSFEREGEAWRLLPREAPGARDARTVRAFERQWRAYSSLPRIFGKDRDAMARNLHGPRMGSRITASWYAGRRVLDAGCGHGRYLPAFASLGAEVVGLEAGRVDALQDLARADPRVRIVRGSVLRPPFRPGTFDLVFCDGVLHHTSDPRAGFLALARLVRPGGALYAWLYPKEGPVREAVFGAARAVTTRLPGPLVLLLSFALAPLTAFVRSYSGTRLGRATWAECAQVVHDWLAPPRQSHHAFREVAGWAVEAGLAPVEELPVATGVVAWRPPERPVD